LELHLPGSAVGYLLGVAGYDSDTEDEIRIQLNGSPLVDLPRGANNAWGAPYRLLLPDAWLASGDNRLLLANRGLATETWGVRLDGQRAFGASLGNDPNLPAARRETDRTSLPITPGAVPGVLAYRCFDADSAAEIRLLRNGSALGYCPSTANNAGGADRRLAVPANQRQAIVADNL
jgi:hypothetical protein